MNSLKKYDVGLTGKIKRDALLILADEKIHCTLSKPNEASANIQASIPGKFDDRLPFQEKIQNVLKKAFKSNIDFLNLDETNSNLRLVFEKEYKLRSENQTTPAMRFVKKLVEKMEKSIIAMDTVDAPGEENESEEVTSVLLDPDELTLPKPSIILDYYDQKIITKILFELVDLLQVMYGVKIGDNDVQSIAGGKEMVLYRAISTKILDAPRTHGRLGKALSDCEMDITFSLPKKKEEFLVFNIGKEYIKRAEKT